MAWERDTAKKYLGIDPLDDTKDEQIDTAMAYTLSSIELRLGRGLLRTREIVRYVNVTDCCKIQFSRYPIIEVFDIDHGGVPADLLVHHELGWIEHLSLGPKKSIEIDYEAGFNELPPDLERAMWSAFMVAWNDTDPVTGGPPEEGGEATEGKVKSFTVFDGFRLDYQSDPSGTPGTADAADEKIWGWLSPWAGTLSFYRHGPSGAGLGVA